MILDPSRVRFDTTRLCACHDLNMPTARKHSRMPVTTSAGFTASIATLATTDMVRWNMVAQPPGTAARHCRRQPPPLPLPVSQTHRGHKQRTVLLRVTPSCTAAPRSFARWQGWCHPVHPPTHPQWCHLQDLVLVRHSVTLRACVCVHAGV